MRPFLCVVPRLLVFALLAGCSSPRTPVYTVTVATPTRTTPYPPFDVIDGIQISSKESIPTIVDSYRRSKRGNGSAMHPASTDALKMIQILDKATNCTTPRCIKAWMNHTRDTLTQTARTPEPLLPGKEQRRAAIQAYIKSFIVVADVRAAQLGDPEVHLSPNAPTYEQAKKEALASARQFDALLALLPKKKRD